MVSAFSKAKDESEEITFRRIELSDDEDNHSAKDLLLKSNGVDLGASDHAASDMNEVDVDSEVGSANEDEDVYVVEQIVRHRKNKKTRNYEYLVRWEGYGSEDDTWEPHDNIAESASALVDTYWAPRGGYEANRVDIPIGVTSKRKRVSSSADVLATNTIQSKRRKQGDSGPVSNLKQVTSAQPDILNKTQSKESDWHPPLELKSWENLAVVETLEKDEHNELYVHLEWPKEKTRSRHRASVVYQKLPQSMLRFYEANIVFKAIKTN